MANNCPAVPWMPSDFWKHVDLRDDDDCWLYLGPGTRGPYGHVRVTQAGRKEYAHRVAYGLAGGRLLEDQQIVRHSCDVGGCVNPRHLGRGTPAENVRDRDERARRTPFLPRGPMHWSSRLTDRDAVAIRRARGLGLSAEVIGAMYVVSPSTIRNVWSGRHYGDVVVA